MNNHINTFLDRYIQDPDPRYAVAITGKWGSGKTYFVESWLSRLNRSFEVTNDESIVLKPISISLYGLKNTREVVTAINRELYPMLYSKGAQTIKKIFKVVGKVTLNSNFDFDNDGNEDSSFSISLDSLGLFKSNDKIIGGDKFLIFDDFERSSINQKELFGFINWFIEKAHCHVLIVGDFSRLEAKDKSMFDEFREKTIGRILEISPELDSAVHSFIQEPSCHQWFLDKKDLICRCFNTTTNHNLRILRQSIRDFNGILDQSCNYLNSTNGTIKSDSTFLKAFFSCFILIFTLYHDKEWKGVIEYYTNKYFYKQSDQDDPIKEKISTLQNQCQNISNFINYNVLDTDFIRNIVLFLEGKSTLVDFVEAKLKKESLKPSDLDRLSLYQNLEDNEFNEIYDRIEKGIINLEIEDLYELGRYIDLFLLFNELKLHLIKDDVLIKVKEKLHLKMKACESAEAIHNIKSKFIRGCKYTHPDTAARYSLIQEINQLAAKLCYQVPNRMQYILRNLNDSSVQQLEIIEKEQVPGDISTYEDISIFENEKSKEVFDALQRMLNSGRQIFNFFLRRHYNLDYALDIDADKKYGKDLTFLKELKHLIDTKLKYLNYGPTLLSYSWLSDTIKLSIETITGKGIS
ncbi:MAG: KAP family NTPase [Muribaculaceae bacterium]|nr:KAP family NTPase [Muribaculaceae bacterium]